MRKIVFYTQRVEIVEAYGERRDCTDQNIPKLLLDCGYLPLAVSNMCKDLDELFDLNTAGILLTGGNSLVKYGGNAPERDMMEKWLIDKAIVKGVPVFGFCRGMQVILDYFGCNLRNITGHAAVYHKICVEDGSIMVNSYHNQGCMELTTGSGLMEMASAEDGVIEAVRHISYPIYGIMWHPEREKIWHKRDTDLIMNLFG